MPAPAGYTLVGTYSMPPAGRPGGGVLRVDVYRRN
jgi:hypothetical protein